MGLELLEEKYHTYMRQNPQHRAVLLSIAARVSRVQKDMRALFDGITSVLCRDCKAPCCQCMPVDGWFTESDYFLYRALHEAPFDLRTPHTDGRSCAFLGIAGCVLPEDMRPFPCVKVNCKQVAEALKARGELAAFTRLYDELERLQEEVWPLLADILSTNVIQAQSL